MIKAVFSAVCLSFCFTLFAQEHHASQSDVPLEQADEYKKNILSASFGYAYILEGTTNFYSTGSEGVYVPSIGLDYFRKLNHKWELGLMIDLELSEYLISHKNLGREKAFLIAGVAAYEPLPHISFLLGGGIELEHHKNLAVIRTGIEFPFRLNEDFFIAPSIVYDIKEGFNTLSASIAFGLKF